MKSVKSRVLSRLRYFNLCFDMCMFLFGCSEGYGAERLFQQYFSCMVAVNFIGGGNPNTWRKHRSDASH